MNRILLVLQTFIIIGTIGSSSSPPSSSLLPPSLPPQEPQYWWIIVVICVSLGLIALCLIWYCYCTRRFKNATRKAFQGVQTISNRPNHPKMVVVAHTPINITETTAKPDRHRGGKGVSRQQYLSG